MAKPSDSETIGSALGRTSWDYSPEDAGIGLLSPMSRFFRGFPWEGRRGEPAPPAMQRPREGEEPAPEELLEEP